VGHLPHRGGTGDGERCFVAVNGCSPRTPRPRLDARILMRDLRTPNPLPGTNDQVTAGRSHRGSSVATES
jgi:hypothetical protein